MIAFLACAPAPLPGDPPLARVAVSPEVPTSLAVSVIAAPWEGLPQVEVSLDGTLVRTVPAPGGLARVVGLLPDRDYTFAPVVDGRRGLPVAHHTAALPEGLLPIEVLDADPEGDLSGGAFAVALTDLAHAYVAIADGEGNWVWWVDGGPDRTFAAPRLTEDGLGLLFLATDRAREADDQRAVRVELDGSRRVETPVPAAHHMVAEVGDELAWLQWDIREVPWDGGAEASVLSDAVRVGDHPIYSFFDARAPTVPCEHGLLPDERLGEDVFEWTHANSLVAGPDGETVYVLARLLDALIAFDRRTGEVRWELGGLDATIGWADPADAFSHGHTSEVWDGGALVFDNGSHHEPQRSRIVEYAIDPAAGAAEAVWTHDQPLGGFTSYLGDARRLPSGGVLVAWTEIGVIQEVGRDHAARWTGALAPGVVPGRLVFLPAFPP